MASVLLNDETVDAVLQLLVTLAHSTMDCVDGASVSLLRSRQFGTQSATTDEVREADRVQYDILRRASQRSNRKLHEVALGVVQARETHN